MVVVGKLSDAVVVALADGAVRQRFADLGMELFPREQQTPEALRTFHKAEIEKWWPIIKGGEHQGRVIRRGQAIPAEGFTVPVHRVRQSMPDPGLSCYADDSGAY